MSQLESDIGQVEQLEIESLELESRGLERRQIAKLKLMTIVGTRPEIIRLAAIIPECDQAFEHILVHTGQNWDYRLNEIFFQELELRQPDYVLDVAGKHVGETIANIIARSYEIMLEEKPDAVLVLGDTNSALSTIAAKRLKIPIFHMEAGNRCFDQNVPEEINRRLVDHISDINLAYTEHSRRYLLSEGCRQEHIFVTGSPMREVLQKYAEKIEASSILEDLELSKQGYILVSAHREENIDLKQNFEELLEALQAVAEQYQLPIIYSTHPRTSKKLREQQASLHPLIHCYAPFGFFDYNYLQKNAFCVLSDSGTLSEESAMQQFPAVLLRTSTERPEVLDSGSMVIGGIQAEQILTAIQTALRLQKREQEIKIPNEYEEQQVSMKVIKIIESYTKIINQYVWRKKA